MEKLQKEVEVKTQVPEAPEKPVKKVKLTRQERKKLRVINRLIAGEINGPKAAKMLKLTTRQIRNLKRQVLEEGEEGVVHKNHYNKPYNTYDSEISEFVVKLYRKEYRGVNFSEFARICQEEHGITASRSTIYNFLRRARIRSPQRKRKKRKTTTTATKATTTTKAASTKAKATTKAVVKHDAKASALVVTNDNNLLVVDSSKNNNDTPTNK